MPALPSDNSAPIPSSDGRTGDFKKGEDMVYIEKRKSNITKYFIARHNGRSPNDSEKLLIDRLVAVMMEYDDKYRDSKEEKRLYKKSTQLRKLLGILITDSGDDKKKKKRRGHDTIL